MKIKVAYNRGEKEINIYRIAVELSLLDKQHPGYDPNKVFYDINGYGFDTCVPVTLKSFTPFDKIDFSAASVFDQAQELERVLEKIEYCNAELLEMDTAFLLHEPTQVQILKRKSLIRKENSLCRQFEGLLQGDRVRTVPAGNMKEEKEES